jgi:hypothetical protein
MSQGAGVSIQVSRPPHPVDATALQVPLRGRVVVEGRIPVDDDSAPYPAAGGFFWDAVLREKRGPLSPD